MSKYGRSPEAQAYRHLYSTKAWKARRAEQLAKEPLCRMCAADGRTVGGWVADHIIPHKGDLVLFFEGELQTLCDAPSPTRPGFYCHSSRKQKIEALGYEPGCDLKGRPRDVGHPWNRPK